MTGNELTKAQQLATRVKSPFDMGEANESSGNTTMAITSQAMAAVQGAVVMAKKYPRDQAAATNRIIDACTRQSLANEALYQYPRGGQAIIGPSIRLAEVMAQNWGNMDFGIIELSQEYGRSQVMAYAWDLETNVRAQKIFMVEHKRKAKGEVKILTDPRDIYEMAANQGARRLRSCILSILPRDVTEAAVDQVFLTQKNSVKAPDEEISKLVEAFKQFGVTEAHIKKRLGHKLEATTAAEVIRFRQIYGSLRDEMAGPEDFFDMDGKDAPPENNKGSTSAIKDKLRGPDPAATEVEHEEQEITDSAGDAFDPDLHVVDKETGEIVYNTDGSFRKRPGAAKKEEDLL